ncbi:MAG: substrate-binding domain-containing protein [Pleomorphochaeta sp.]|nr:LacI family DNA-binding transcriptional regulator [Sphaerochaetaceae bacterium]
MNDKSAKKYEIIAQHIIEKIENKEWKEGDIIPTVRELAKLYNVSPQTANKATAHLVGLGILSSRQGSGSIIKKQDFHKDHKYISMLIDKARSTYIHGINSAMGYHAKEIYLSYLHAMEQVEESAKLIIYDKNDKSIKDPSLFENVEGLLIQGTLPSCYLDFIRKNDIPTVVINKTVEKANEGRIGSVFMDYYGLEQLCTYLASLGHNKIIYAFSNEFELTEVYERRLSIIENSLQKTFNNNNFTLYKFNFSKDNYKDGEKLQELHNNGYNAMLCYNDITALRAYDLLHQLQIRIPEEMSVTGFDDLFMAEIAAPPLTTVKIDRTQLLNDSMDLLKELIATKQSSYPIKETKTELILRRSCWKSMN